MIGEPPALTGEAGGAGPPPASHAGRAGLGRSAVSGASKLLLSSVSVQLIGLAASVVVARHLLPADYGTVAVAQTTLALAQVLGGLGLAPAIATGRLRDPGHLSAAALLLFGFGAVLCLAYVATAPSIAKWFGVATSVGVLRVSALSVPLSFVTVVPVALLQRELKFSRMSALAIIPQALAAVLGVSMAVGGAGVWALVLPGLVAGVCSAIWSCAMVWPQVWSPPRLRGLKSLIGESGSLIGFQALNYGARQGDNLIVGRLLGPVQLGVYAFAYGQLTRPLSLITGTVSNALVPAIGHAAGDPDRLGRGVTRAVCLTARVAGPVFVGGALLSDRIVHQLFGPRWDAALPLVRVFLLLALPQALAALLGSAWVAVGASRVLFLWQLAVTPIFLAVFLAAGYLGGSALAVGVAYAAASTTLLPAVFLVSRRVTGLHLRATAQSLGRLAVDLAVMSILVLGLGWILDRIAHSNILIPMAQAGAGAMMYLALFRRFSRPELLSLLELFPPGIQTQLRRVLGVDESAS